MKTIRAFLSFALLLALASAGCGRPVEGPKIAAKPYAYDVCAVCGMKLSEMDKPYVFVYQDREIKVCDKGEEADFRKEPEKYLKALETAGTKKAPAKTP